MIKYQLPNWTKVFENVCRRGKKSLEWGLPEQWVHAELFSELASEASQTGWLPFSTELPYLTYFPVTLPNPDHHDWKSNGAIKWVDLCLLNEALNAWCWFELKVRHRYSGAREHTSARSALEAIAKDYVGLCGLDPGKTSTTWTEPGQSTKAYWFDEVLGPHAQTLSSAKHYFVSAYLQLGGPLNPEVFSESLVIERISSWHQRRSSQSHQEVLLPETTITIEPIISGGHSLLICQSSASC